MADRRRALIVANSDYVDPAFRGLTAPVHDARELARVLSNPSIGSFEVETLLNEKSGFVNQLDSAEFDPSFMQPFVLNPKEYLGECIGR
jgi:hypothetical protein